MILLGQKYTISLNQVPQLQTKKKCVGVCDRWGASLPKNCWQSLVCFWEPTINDDFIVIVLKGRNDTLKHLPPDLCEKPSVLPLPHQCYKVEPKNYFVATCVEKKSVVPNKFVKKSYKCKRMSFKEIMINVSDAFKIHF